MVPAKAEKAESTRLSGSGFTLIEMLVVIAIAGILTAIAIPQYLGYRVRARNAAASTDASSFRVAQEEIRLARGSYGGSDCLQPAGAGGTGGVGGFLPSKTQGEVTLVDFLAVPNGFTYKAALAHPNGSKFYIVTEAGIAEGDCGGSDCTDDVADDWGPAADCPAVSCNPCP